jgi:lysophospholipase L1-like esterase
MMTTKKTMTLIVLIMLMTGIVGNITAEEFQTQPAQKIVSRDGIGHFLQKLDAKQDVTIAYLGGSITAANGWRVKTSDWFRKIYPESKITEIHAAIGGTGSDLGVYRLKHDVLQYQPDLLFIEFAVNDGGAPPEQIWRCMEGIVRQTWQENPDTDIIFIYTFVVGFANELESGKCSRSASAMEQVAAFYGIPSINVAVPIVELKKADKLIYQSDNKEEDGLIVFSQDGVHPHDAGHEIYTKLIVEAIEQFSAEQPENRKIANNKTKLAKTFIADNCEAAKMIPIEKSMLIGEWRELPPDDNLQKTFQKQMGQLWESGTPGSRISFKFCGSEVKLYDLLGPDGGQVIMTVDGKTSEKPIPRFDSYCVYYRSATLNIAAGLDPNQEHQVTVEIHPEQPDRRSVAFRLKSPETELKEPKFQGTKLRVGQVMLIGELIK